jgi:hypothetical protein
MNNSLFILFFSVSKKVFIPNHLLIIVSVVSIWVRDVSVLEYRGGHEHEVLHPPQEKSCLC